MESPYNIVLIDNRNKLSKLDILKEDAIVNDSSHTYCIGFDAFSNLNFSHTNMFGGS